MSSLLDKSIQYLNAAGVVWVFALMFLICADIVARTMFDNPIAGVTEMVSMSLVATVFMQLPHAVRSGRLTRTEFLIDYLESSSPAAASGFKCLALVCGASIFGLVALGTWPDLRVAVQTSEFVGVEGIYTMSIWPVRLFIVVGSLLAALSCCLEIVVGPPDGSEGGAPAGWLSIPMLLLLSAAVLALGSSGASDQVIGVAMIIGVLVLIVTGILKLIANGAIAANAGVTDKIKEILDMIQAAAYHHAGLARYIVKHPAEFGV